MGLSRDGFRLHEHATLLALVIRPTNLTEVSPMVISSTRTVRLIWYRSILEMSFAFVTQVIFHSSALSALSKDREL